MISSIILLDRPGRRRRLHALLPAPRARGEGARGAGKLEAVDTAAATSGRAVLVSGFTVMAAMAGMFLAGDRTFTSLGIGAIMVVAVAMIGSLTVVPAMLAALGDRVDKGRIPFLHRAQARPTARAASGTRSSTRVLRRPALSAGLAAAAARRARDPGVLDAHRADRHRRPAAQARGHEGLRPHAGRVPRRRRSRPSSRSRRATSRRRRSRPRSSELERQGRRDGHDERAGRRHASARTSTSRSINVPMKGDGTDAVSSRARGRAARRDRRQHGRPGAGRAPAPTCPAWPRSRRTGTT